METVRTWEDQIRDVSPPWLPPYGMEKQVLAEFGWNYNVTRDEDRDAMQRVSWNWPTACAWIAWQKFEGAASGVAAFRVWHGMLWREKEFDVRPGRLMPLSKAEIDLRNALEADKLKASAVRGNDVVSIPAGEWPRLAWEQAEHGEVIEFDHLTLLGARRYQGVMVPRAGVLQTWPALDGWAPDGADVDFTETSSAATPAHSETVLPSLPLPANRQERLNAIAANNLSNGLRWKRGGSKKDGGTPGDYQFHRTLEERFGAEVSRDNEAREAWDHHYPFKPKAGRPRKNNDADMA